MVKIMENPITMDDLGGKKSLFLETPMLVCCFLAPLSICQVTNPPIDPIREAVVMSLGGGLVQREMHRATGLKSKKHGDFCFLNKKF